MEGSSCPAQICQLPQTTQHTNAPRCWLYIRHNVSRDRFCSSWRARAPWCPLIWALALPFPDLQSPGPGAHGQHPLSSSLHGDRHILPPPEPAPASPGPPLPADHGHQNCLGVTVKTDSSPTQTHRPRISRVNEHCHTKRAWACTPLVRLGKNVMYWETHET